MLKKSILEDLLYKEYEKIDRTPNDAIKNIKAVIVFSAEELEVSGNNKKRIMEGIKIVNSLPTNTPFVYLGTKKQNAELKKFLKGKVISKKILFPSNRITANTRLQTMDLIKFIKKKSLKNILIVSHFEHLPRIKRYLSLDKSSNLQIQIWPVGSLKSRSSFVMPEIERIIKYAEMGDLPLFYKNVTLIIQARMQSKRFPGKVLKMLGKHPMLFYVLQRLKDTNGYYRVVLATSTQNYDNKIASFATKCGVDIFRGDLNNVLKRYYYAAKKYNGDIIIRVTADCPLIDKDLIIEGLLKFIEGGFDYLSNTLTRTFPRGFDFEIMSFDALEKAYIHATRIEEKEHVTPYIWLYHPELFNISELCTSPNKSNYRITVDTEQDFLLVKRLIEKYQADEKNYIQIIKILDNNKRLVEINKDVKQVMIN